jgi:hypothetical protein
LRSCAEPGFVEEVPVGFAEEAWRSDGDGRYGLRITAAGLKAIGVPALASGLEAGLGDDQPTEAAVPTAAPQQKPPRPGSKLARLVELLREPSGRTVDELATTLGWLPHTTREVISRLQKSGHVVTRTKSDDGRSVYRIEAPAEATASDQDA